MRTSLLLFLVAVLTGCSAQQLPLMPTPLYYQISKVGPLADVPLEQRWNFRKVYYVTNRQRQNDFQRLGYGNAVADTIATGLAMVSFGGPNVSWEDLEAVSITADRPEVIPLSIAGLFEAGNYSLGATGDIVESQGSVNWLVRDLDTSVMTARDQDILVYVHGAKTSFYDSTVFAAQLDHFLGRDMTSISFSWPTHDNIYSYFTGTDVSRAYTSAPVLNSLITALANNTQARRIHILAWSAGGRVVSEALRLLRESEADLTSEELRQKYRLGTVYFAAADVPLDDFLVALPGINDMVNSVIVTASEEDGALRSAETFMRGDTRIGLVSDQALTEEQQAAVLAADRLQYIDLSAGADVRGFNIAGHNYWFNHPWASTDALLSIRTDLEPQARGLEPTASPQLWIMPADYPQRVEGLVNEVPVESFRHIR